MSYVRELPTSATERVATILLALVYFIGIPALAWVIFA